MATTTKVTKVNTKTRSVKKAISKPSADIPDDKKYRCTVCGKETISPVNRFYKSPSKLFAGNDGFTHICRECLTTMFETYKRRYDEVTAVKIVCHYLDIPFYTNLYVSLITATDDFTIGKYIRQMNNAQFKGKTFVNTLLDKEELGIEVEEKEKIMEEKWTLPELRAKNDVIEIVGYDPFEGYDVYQRRFLFNNTIAYLQEDGIEDDPYKVSQILQLVNNNYQIDQVNITLAKLDPQQNSDEFKALNQMKKSLVDANDKIAKENGISVKNRIDKQAGRSTLTFLMKYLRENGVVEAEANYYDQLRSPGSHWAANMSLQAIKENGFFDENDQKDIFEAQYSKIQELQKKLDDVEEENRLLLIENDELKTKPVAKDGA